jgi:basic membrane lipoprotein Med (substrate-binding protein (PBP1-ABC) superfamily)
MKRILTLALIAALCLAVPLAVFAQAKPFKIGVYVPGVVAGSPLYEQMVAGCEKALKEFPNASMKVIEAGFNQGEWQEKMTSLAATGEYDLILSSNGAMPFICAETAKAFPKQKFLVVDSYLAGNPQIATLLYNQVEQGYLVGYLGGLVTKSKMPGANADLKAGAMVGQQYPAMDKMIIPGFEQGLKAVDPKITLDVRVLGNWYDANKAADLTNSLIDAGADVIMTACGGANEGVIKAAKARGKYVFYFDANEYKIAPGTIIGCAVLNQEKAVYERVKLAIQGKLAYGKAEIVNAKDGYVDLADNDPLYINNVAADVRQKMADVTKKIRTGALALQVPQL